MDKLPAKNADITLDRVPLCPCWPRVHTDEIQSTKMSLQLQTSYVNKSQHSAFSQRCSNMHFEQFS